MNLSMNWLSDFVKTDGIEIKEYCDRMTDSGSKVESYTLLGDDVRNVVVARIKSLEKHPDSDHLVICIVDCGEFGTDIQIVTGAPNVNVGDHVQLQGRFQSRVYQKQLPDGTVQERTAYEVSVSRLTLESAAGAPLAEHDAPSRPGYSGALQ